MRYITLSIVILLSVFSCGNNDLYDFLNRSIDDPIVASPRVECFKTEMEISVSWDSDKAADEYFLYRDTNPLGEFSDLIYHGTDLSYLDREVTKDTLYYYSLAKRKEGMLFEKSKSVLGVTNNSVRDEHEVNDTYELAVSDSKKINIPADSADGPKMRVWSSTDANIFYYQDGNGNVLEDIDWYWVYVTAGRTFKLKIQSTTHNLSPNQLAYLEYGTSKEVVITNAPDQIITITNGDSIDRIKYFEVYVNSAQFLKTAPSGLIGDYNLSPVD